MSGNKNFSGTAMDLFTCSARGESGFTDFGRPGDDSISQLSDGVYPNSDDRFHV